MSVPMSANSPDLPSPELLRPDLSLRHRAGPQVIPEPPGHRLGGPAPWAHLSAEDRSSISLDRVLDAVAGRDRSADAAAAAEQVEEFSRSFGGTSVASTPAAVLVACFEEDGEARVVLTVRSGHLRAHRGEVAFPGGKLDPGEGIDEGALREAHEEIGLSPQGVEVIGHLTAMPTVSSNTLMTPVVAMLPGRPRTSPAPDEVARVFDVALADLAADDVFIEELWAVPGRIGADGQPGGEFPVWFFQGEDEVIWGATARVLSELLCAVLGIPVPFARRGG